MRKLIAGLALGGMLLLAGCGDTPREARQTTAPKLEIRKIAEVNYDDEAYYARMIIGGRECIVLVTHASESESGSGISCDWSNR
jgi:hypothetical protein